MAKEPKPTDKKKYEPPSITSPESGPKGKGGFAPLGTTGCQYGDIGATCANGNQPQGGPGDCAVGSQPSVLDCNTGTTAGDACINGTDALTSCDVGTAVLGNCTSGSSPLGPGCTNGSTGA